MAFGDLLTGARGGELFSFALGFLFSSTRETSHLRGTHDSFDANIAGDRKKLHRRRLKLSPLSLLISSLTYFLRLLRRRYPRAPLPKPGGCGVVSRVGGRRCWVGCGEGSAAHEAWSSVHPRSKETQRRFISTSHCASTHHAHTSVEHKLSVLLNDVDSPGGAQQRSLSIHLFFLKRLNSTQLMCISLLLKYRSVLR